MATIGVLCGGFAEASPREAGCVDVYPGPGKFIKDWQSAGGSNRFVYSVTLLDGRICAIELKGSQDANNTNIFERPTTCRNS